MPSLRIQSMGSLTLAASLCLGACSGTETDPESLPAITESQAETFGERFAKASCEKMAECFDEAVGDVPFQDDEGFPGGLEMCVEMLTSQFQSAFKECEHWDKKLADVCIEDMKDAKCERDGNDFEVKAESCDDLLERCGLDMDAEDWMHQGLE